MTKLKTFAFDIHRDLPIIATAFMNGELQYQKKLRKRDDCSYAGPCGLGICIPKADRKWFDNAKYMEKGVAKYIVTGDARDLFAHKVFTAPDLRQRRSFERIQGEHDQLLLDVNQTSKRKNATFKRTLVAIATKHEIDLSAIFMKEQ